MTTTGRDAAPPELEIGADALAVALGPPGWYGKLPGLGDFAQRRLPEAFTTALDGWLQQGLAGLRQRHADWTERYLESPLWSFLLGEQVSGPARWIGVLMPSVDAVGRYFPLTLASEIALPAQQAELRGAALAQARRWWRLGAQAALEGLEHDHDAARFDAALARHFEADDAAAPDDADACCPLPAAGQSLWLSDPQSAGGWRLHEPAGLPTGTRFDALFGFADAAPADDPAEAAP